MHPLFEQYAFSNLNNSSSVVQFLSRPKGGFQGGPVQVSNTGNILYPRALAPSQIQQRRHLRTSKSCTKGCHIGLSPNSSQLEAVYGPDRSSVVKESLPSTKKPNSAIKKDNTINKLSSDTKHIKKNNVSLGNYNAALAYITQNKATSNRKFLSTTVIQKGDKRVGSIKRKRANDSLISQNKFEWDPRSEIDTSITDTTSKHIEDSNKRIDYGKTLVFNLIKSWNEIEKDKGKNEFIQTLLLKFEIINDSLTGAINLNTVLSDTLRQIQSKLKDLQFENNEYWTHHKGDFGKMQTEVVELQKECNKLETEKEELIKDNKQQSVLLQKGSKIERELMNQIDELKQLKKKAEARIKELSIDANDLYRENKGLAKIAKKLYTELEETKKREQNLIRLLKEEGKDIRELKKKEEKKEKIMIQVGKNKVKMPTLDLTKLIPKRAAKLKVVKYYKGNKSDENSEESNVACNNSEEESESALEQELSLENFLDHLGEQSYSINSSIKTN